MPNIESIEDFISYLNEYADGLTLLWAVLGGLAGITLLFSKKIIAYFLPAPNHTEEKAIPININLSAGLDNSMRSIIREELSHIEIQRASRSVEGDPNDSELSLLDAIEQLSSMRERLKPPPFDSKMLPSDVTLVKEVRNEKLVVGVPTSRRERIFIGLFCLPHYLIFPAIPFFVVGVGWLGVLVGAALWVWQNRLGWRVSINLRKKSYGVIMPAAASFYNELPLVTLIDEQLGSTWITKLLIGGQVVVERTSLEHVDHQDLKQVAKSLQWIFGQKIEVAEGVYIAA